MSDKLTENPQNKETTDSVETTENQPVLNTSKKHPFRWLNRPEKKVFIKNFAYGIMGIFVLSVIINSVISVKLIQAGKKSTPAQIGYIPQKSAEISYAVVRKNVLNRNLFNNEGNLPPEDLDDSNTGLISNFAEVPCSTQEDKLPVELVGILYTGNPKTNLVTFKDSRVETADVYREGQHLIEYDAYQIYKISGPSTVQIRNQNKKICLSTGTEERAKTKSDDDSQEDELVTELDSGYVSEQIGPGFSRILNSARLVPESVDGKTIGFKIYGITSGSLFEKIKLENGDVITGVNGIDLEDPAQGFKVYEALQDETNITLLINRAGALMTIKVIVR